MKKIVVILVVNFSFIFLEATTAAVVVYKGFSSRICVDPGGGSTGSHVTGSDRNRS